MNPQRLICGQTLSFRSDAAAVHEERGAVAISDEGRILWSGSAENLPSAYADTQRDDYGRCLVLAGFIDPHIHFPQYRMLAADKTRVSGRLDGTIHRAP